MAAGVVFTDDATRVLLLRPTYKDYWDIPGGYVVTGESPRQAAAREVREELGLSVTVGAMLAVDWAPSENEGDKILFLFAGPNLPTGTAFCFADGEISEARYVATGELERYTITRLARRLRSAVRSSGVAYLEHGEPPVSNAP